MIDEFEGNRRGEPDDRTEVLRAGAAAARGEDPPSFRCGLGPRADERRDSETARLLCFAQSRGILVRDFPGAVENLPVRGNEHCVDLSISGGRIRKYTTKNHPAGVTFLLDSELQPVRLIHALPSEYLERLALQNEIFGDSIGLESISESGRFQISQPYRSGEHPPRELILEYLLNKGFSEKTNIAEQKYYTHPDGIIVGDEKPQNWSMTPSFDLIPIDLLILDLHPPQRMTSNRVD